MKKNLKVIDLFAGAGGFSTGAMQAGANIIWAGNHWPEAVEIHSKNHPHAVHFCQDLHQANWSRIPSHHLMLASPACQGHSRARGRERKYHDETRSTAYAILGAADYHRPPFIVIENVPEFLSWDGFRGWRTTLEDFGYRLEINRLNAQDFGVPQSRERIFITACRGAYLKLEHPSMDHVPAKSFIQWKSGDWSSIRKAGRSQRTLEQIRNGRKLYGDRFLIAYYGAEKNGRSLNRPCGTITTRDRFAIINGDKMRMLNRYEVRDAMGFPKNYLLPDQHALAIHLLGNAVCPPVAEYIVRQIMKVA